MRDDLEVIVQRWLQKAKNDLRTAETVLRIEPPVTDTACFHAHQCAEKCLKSYLTSVNVQVERTHDLVRLVEICSETDSEFAELRNSAMILVDYAVASRYPDDWREFPVEEAMSALEEAAKVMEFVRKNLQQ